MASYLTELDASARRGAMMPDQAATSRLLLHRLRDALPIIEHLHLYRPPLSLPG